MLILQMMNNTLLSLPKLHNIPPASVPCKSMANYQIEVTLPCQKIALITQIYRNYGKLSLILQPIYSILKTVRHV